MAKSGQAQIRQIFKDTGALLQGHFLLTSGKHSAQYMQCAQVLQHPRIAGQLGQALAGKFAGIEIETVIGPAMGGIIVAHEVGRALGVRAIFAERKNGEMALRRGFLLQPGERVLVVEDGLPPVVRSRGDRLLKQPEQSRWALVFSSTAVVVG